jgi:hypothetical protein
MFVPEARLHNCATLEDSAASVFIWDCGLFLRFIVGVLFKKYSLSSDALHHCFVLHCSSST